MLPIEGPVRGTSEGIKIKIPYDREGKTLCMEQSSDSKGSSNYAGSSNYKGCCRFSSGSHILARSINNPNYRN
jgi:hypothetical protein